MLSAHGEYSADKARSPDDELIGRVDEKGFFRSLAGQHGVRIATLSRLFVIFLVLMTFGIVWITLINVGSGREVVDQWRALEQSNALKNAAVRRLDMAELINSYQLFLGRADQESRQVVLSNVEESERAIAAYKATNTSNTENQALQTISRAVESYRIAVTDVFEKDTRQRIHSEKIAELNANTYQAILAVKMLKAEHDYQRDIGFARMGTSVEGMMSVLKIIAVSSSIMAALIGASIWWLSNRLLINPLLALKLSMIKLARGDIGEEKRPEEMLTDICEMATSVEVFRRNLIDAERLRKEEKEAQQRIRILSQAIEQSPASVVLVDLDKRIQYSNPQFSDVSGYSENELTGKVFDAMLLPDAEKNSGDHIWRRASVSGGWSGEILSQAKDGNHIWAHLVVSPVRDANEKISHFLVVLEDISQRKEFEARLIEAKETAEVAYRSKTEFLANMTHELRTPLNAIIGFSEIIKGEMLGPLEQPSYLEYSNDIYDSGRHLLGLIEDILDFSKIEAGKMELVEEEMDLLPAIQLSRNIVGERARREDIAIHLDLPDQPVLLKADERKIKQVLLNLVSNAVKFSHGDSEVIIGARIDAEQQVQIYVRDFGIGISPDDITTALAPFGQVESKLSRTYEGTGLGLPLSKSLVEAHGGCLTIESERDVGTTVTAIFPAERNLNGLPEKTLVETT